jgi:lipopolysaccharide transport system permease protein
VSLIRGHRAAAIEVASLLWRHRSLTMAMARRELADRYAGQALGLSWVVVHPLFMILLYVFIFGVVFRQRIGGTVEMPLDYIAYLLSGLAAWLTVQDAVIKSCNVITGNSSLVKQVVFPLEVLPVKSLLVSFVPQGVTLAFLVIYVLVQQGSLPVTYALLPVLLIMQLLLLLGIAFVLAPAGAYARDLKDVMQLMATAGPYLVPVFYLPQWVPPMLRPLLFLNPFSHLIWCYQDALYFGRIDHPWSWLVTAVLSVVSFVLGYRVFRRLRPALGNVL